jgi:hypothetical protein
MKIAATVLTFSALLNGCWADPQPANVIACPHDLRAKASVIETRSGSLTETLKGLYDASREHLNSGLRAFVGRSKFDVNKPTEVIRCKISDARIDLDRVIPVWLSIGFDPKSMDIRWIDVAVEVPLNRTVKELQKSNIFPENTIVDKVLSLERFKKAPFTNAVVSEVSVHYQDILWPSSVLRGEGFTVGLKIANVGEEREDATFAFGGFSKVHQSAGAKVYRRVAGPTPADELLVIGTPGEIQEAPEIFEW